MAISKLQAEFDREFRGHIERFTEPLVAALRKLIATPLPPSPSDEGGWEFEVLSFEVYSDWTDFPIRVFAMDRNASDDVYYVAPFSGPILPKAGRLIPRGAIDQDRYEMAGVATFESGARVLAEWFGECWHAAGGTKFPLPAYIHHHDRSLYFDLHSRQWVNDTDIDMS